MTESKPTCFVIMPISTPEKMINRYGGDKNHFTNVFKSIFAPAIEKAGFTPISPASTGSDIIQADIIENLSASDLVLCDMSTLNPNVFFEFGIRTALDKPVALIVDDITTKIPFDTHMINHHAYRSVPVWTIDEEIKKLKQHLIAVYEKANDQNALWKYFGITRSGAFEPEKATVEDKLDYLIREVNTLNYGEDPVSEDLGFDKLPPPPPAFPDGWEDL